MNKISIIIALATVAGGIYAVRNLSYTNNMARPNLQSQIVSQEVEENAVVPGPNQIKINDVILSVEVSDTAESRTQGLSGKETLRQDAGMLFIFDAPTVPSFWMKDMSIWLDIIWIDSRGTIIGFEENVSPATYPRTYSPESPILYVLEVNAGWVKQNNVNVGDNVLGSVIK